MYLSAKYFNKNIEPFYWTFHIMSVFVQAASGVGGWPMSVFLTPDLKPIGGGTYYPPEDAYGRPGFKSILLHMAKRVILF